MAAKLFQVDPIGELQIIKRRDARNLRLAISAKGQVRVTIPSWAPFQSGIDYALSQTGWISQHRPVAPDQLQDGLRVGKAHRLIFSSATSDKPSSRLSGNEIRVSRPAGWSINHPEVQKVAEKACHRALRTEAEALLPQRLQSLAAKFGFNYKTVAIKQLKGRWGSCDSQTNIIFNLFLMQLPWQLIDYVIIHELVHTKHLNHGESFWREFVRCEPSARELRRETRRYQPILRTTAQASGVS